jgi:hypothetical protein
VTCAGADGTDAKAEVVRSGMAWVFDKYVTDRTLYAVQDEARADWRGLWADRDPVATWVWRKGSRRTDEVLPGLSRTYFTRGSAAWSLVTPSSGMHTFR